MRLLWDKLAQASKNVVQTQPLYRRKYFLWISQSIFRHFGGGPGVNRRRYQRNPLIRSVVQISPPRCMAHFFGETPSDVNVIAVGNLRAACIAKAFHQFFFF